MNFGLGSLNTPTQAAVISAVLALVLAGCGTSAEPENAAEEAATTSASESTASEDSPAPSETQAQEETCDWDSPRVSGPAKAPAGQDGELAEVIVGAWQHTHIDDGNGFEETTNDHRYVFASPDRMLYCQHVPGTTDHAKNTGDITLNGTTIELPGGKYSYTVTAWDEDTLRWDNPVGGGSVYLLQRR